MASRAATPPVAVRKARRFILRRLYSPHLEKGSRSPDARTAFEAIPRPLRLRDASATLEKPHSWTAASSVSSLCTQGQILAVFRRGTWLPPPNPIGPSPDGPPLQGVFWSLSCDWRSS